MERDVPLWLHGSDTAVAVLAGRVADGWVVDLDDVGIEGLAALNAVLDRAAIDAGRDVREIRRSVTLASDHPMDASALVELVVSHG